MTGPNHSTSRHTSQTSLRTFAPPPVRQRIIPRVAPDRLELSFDRFLQQFDAAGVARFFPRPVERRLPVGVGKRGVGAAFQQQIQGFSTTPDGGDVKRR